MKVQVLLAVAMFTVFPFFFPSCSGKSEKITLSDGIGIEMMDVPESNFAICQTEIPQNFYEAVMGENPSSNKGELNPADRVSFYDAIVFCNTLSMKLGKTPAYSINGSTNPADWNYTPHKNRLLEGRIVLCENADGFRLPDYDEWLKAYAGGKEFKWSGSDNYEDVAWVDGNSGKKSHQVKTLNKNGYGIYDIAGNVAEWLWVDKEGNNKLYCGGSFFDGADMALPAKKIYTFGSMQMKTVGLRVAITKNNI